MAEKICVFGPGLVGILLQSQGGGPLANAPAVLLWNVGMNHRVGPYRFYVDLARRIASHAGTVLRFDVSGLGDSELQPGRGSDLERAQLDVQEAMKLLEQRSGIRQFIVVGFCSSVDAAHQLAVNDPRVVGVVYVEGYAYRTPGFYAQIYKRYLSLRHWERYLIAKRERIAGLVTSLVSQEKGAKQGSTGATYREPVFARDYPTREQFRDDVATLVRRGVKLLFLYVGGDTDYLYKGQFEEMYGSPDTRGKVDVVFFEHADHTFVRGADRERAIQAIVDWTRNRFGTSANAP